MTTNITVKGQVTIPKPIRDQLGLKPGEPVEFAYNADGEVVVRAARKKPVPKSIRKQLEAVRGTGRLGMSTDEIMNLLRGYDEDKDDPGFK